jgi:hypothetical protein
MLIPGARLTVDRAKKKFTPSAYPSRAINAPTSSANCLAFAVGSFPLTAASAQAYRCSRTIAPCTRRRAAMTALI